MCRPYFGGYVPSFYTPPWRFCCSSSKMPPESVELELWKEKLLRRSLDDSFSDNDDASEDDILVQGGHSGPSNEDRQLLEEEDEREKLLTKKRNKVVIGSKKTDKKASKHARQKSTESRMEDGILDTWKSAGRSNVRPPASSTPDRRMIDVCRAETTRMST